MKHLIEKVIKFRDDRNWAQYHNAKDLSLAISIEAAELNELFLWKEIWQHHDRKRIKEELADVLIYCLTLAHEMDFDIEQIIDEKMAKNAIKYPNKKMDNNVTNYPCYE